MKPRRAAPGKQMPGDTGPVTMTTNNQTIEAQIQAKGKTAARVTPAEIGRNIARQNAVAKVWPLMGYELRSKLAGAAE